MEYELSPAFNVDIELLEKQVRALNIRSESDKIQASQLLAQIDTKLKELTGRRDDIIGEYQQRIDDVREEYKPYIASLKSLKQTVKDNMLLYNHLAKLELEQIRTGLANGTIERSETYVDETTGRIINESALSIRTEGGLSSVRKHYTLKQCDFSKIPDEFKTFDKKAALKAVREGRVKEIPGIEIIEKDAIQVRSNNVA